MLEENKAIELNDEELSNVSGGGDICDCSWNGTIKYKLEIGCAYVRNGASNYVYVPLEKISSPTPQYGWGGGNSFYVFSCKYYEFGNYVDIHNVSFGENDIITKVTGNY